MISFLRSTTRLVTRFQILLLGFHNMHMMEEQEQDHNNEDDDHHSSPESAGLARGLARSSVATTARHNGGVLSRVAIGRLPKGGAAVTSRTMRNSRFAAQYAKKIKQVAKVSDRASVGFDVWDAASTDSSTAASASSQHSIKAQHQQYQGSGDSSSSAALNTNINNNIQQRKQRQSWITNGSNFIGSLMKNTILGAAVFATYEHITDRWNDSSGISTSTSDGSSSGSGKKLRSISSSSIPLSAHYAAGFCAGSVHAVLGSTIDSIVSSSTSSSNVLLSRLPKQQQQQQQKKEKTKVIVKTISSTKTPPVLGLSLFHAISHSVLFGSYETLKRILTKYDAFFSQRNHNAEDNRRRKRIIANSNLPAIMIDNTNTHTYNNDNNNDDIDHRNSGDYQEKEDISGSFLFYCRHYLDDRFFIITTAGGIAGICQHIISHYTEPLMTMAQPRQQQQQHRTISNMNWSSALQHHLRRFPSTPPPPTLKSLIMAFIPTAIGFVAFEYGKDVL